MRDEVKECFRDRMAVLRSLKKYPVDYIVALNDFLQAGDLTFRGKMPIIYRYGEIKV